MINFHEYYYRSAEKLKTLAGLTLQGFHVSLPTEDDLRSRRFACQPKLQRRLIHRPRLHSYRATPWQAEFTYELRRDRLESGTN